MSEKLNYHNGVNEDLEKLYPNIDHKQTKEDLKSLEFLIKTENEGFTYDEIILLIDKYNDYIRL